MPTAFSTAGMCRLRLRLDPSHIAAPYGAVPQAARISPKTPADIMRHAYSLRIFGLSVSIARRLK